MQEQRRGERATLRQEIRRKHNLDLCERDRELSSSYKEVFCKNDEKNNKVFLTKNRML